MITVACVWVKANVPYGVEYVANLRAMVERHLPMPYEFVCLTDRPWKVPAGVRAIPISSPEPLAGWWAKVRLFDRRLGLNGRILYLDLDSLIVGSLMPILEFQAPFALVPHEGDFNGRDGLAVVKRFNSSVMVWHGPEQAHLFDAWKPAIARRLHGDQDWIGEQRPNAATFPLGWFPRLSRVQAGPIPPEAVVVLAKKPKPAEAVRRWSWVGDVWRAA